MTQLAIKKITMHHENRNYTNVYMCVQGSELYVGKVASVDPTHPYEYYPLGDTPIATNGTVLTIQLWNYDPQ